MRDRPADLQSWEDAYKELQAHNQSQKETYEKQIEEVQANSTAKTSTKKDNSDLDTRLKSLEKANDALNNQLKLTKQELENAHATHRQVLGEMQSDYDKEQQSLKFKLGEVVKRFKMLKAQNDNQKQMIHELTSRMKGNSSNGVGSVMSNGNSKSSSGSSFIYDGNSTRSADVASSVAYTREADNAYMDNIQSYDWYSHDSGTLFAEHNVDRDITSGAWGIVTLENEGSSNNYVGLRYRSSGTSGEVLSFDGASQMSASSISAADLNYFNKAAIAYETNNAAAVGNGGTVSNDSSVIVPNLTQLTIGTGYAINYIGGHIKKIAYYSERLTNSEIQALTENN